ncbi:hypothetical protein GTW43_13805, partial [Streptomyces sp. SID5785]|nr:hypothetical protein [Streptomyces sp. SID5785]
VVRTRPDGEPALVAYKGKLIVRVTNTESGASYDADVGGSALVEMHADGSQRWWATGPILLGVPEGQGNLPRGEYVIDGTYTLTISATGYRTVTWAHGSADDVCERLD